MFKKEIQTQEAAKKKHLKFPFLTRGTLVSVFISYPKSNLSAVDQGLEEKPSQAHPPPMDDLPTFQGPAPAWKILHEILGPNFLGLATWRIIPGLGYVVNNHG